MVSIRIVCVGNLKEKYWKDAIAEYGKRLSRFCNFEVIETPESDPEKEKTAIIKHLQGYIFSLCVEGKQCTSVEFAQKIEKVMQTDSKITFVIGGSDGLSEEVKKLSASRLSFSQMTFPHQLMRVILAEQIYRAFTISNNITYHK
ncbi:MAG: 23S rRNA (pseudouridine(1915)-N(3))-methyltransferase RlmH [Clostridia bacterium]|nr:23S rRNA (pseudouridine(1915)-N(3))-methyltransferase RlmH [Clostridia bacterium]